MLCSINDSSVLQVQQFEGSDASVSRSWQSFDVLGLLRIFWHLWYDFTLAPLRFILLTMLGILTAVCTNPIWVIKTRMLQTGRNSPKAYRNISHGVGEIWRSEGVKGFWRGLVPSLFGVSHGAVQFAAYEQLKNRRKTVIGDDQELRNWDYLLLSGSSKIFAGSLTYPYQVVRARLQTYDAQKTYRGAGDAVAQIWKKEGLRGFYKGYALALLCFRSVADMSSLFPNVVRVLPSTCVTFLVYENTKYYLPRFYEASGNSDLE